MSQYSTDIMVLFHARLGEEHAGSRLVISKSCKIGGVGTGEANVISRCKVDNGEWGITETDDSINDLEYLSEVRNNISEGPSR
jgi:hypothetical protein